MDRFPHQVLEDFRAQENFERLQSTIKSLEADIATLEADVAALSAGAPFVGGIAFSSGDLTLTGSLQDVPSVTATFTPAVASYAIVDAVYDMVLTGTGTSMTLTGAGRLVVDGTPESNNAIIGHFSDGHSNTPVRRAVAKQSYLIALTAASHTLKLQGIGVDLSGGSIVIKATHTSMRYQLVPQ